MFCDVNYQDPETIIIGMMLIIFEADFVLGKKVKNFNYLINIDGITCQRRWAPSLRANTVNSDVTI